MQLDHDDFTINYVDGDKSSGFHGKWQYKYDDHTQLGKFTLDFHFKADESLKKTHVLYQDGGDGEEFTTNYWESGGHLARGHVGMWPLRNKH